MEEFVGKFINENVRIERAETTNNYNTMAVECVRCGETAGITLPDLDEVLDRIKSWSWSHRHVPTFKSATKT